MERWEQIEHMDPRYRLFGTLFLLNTRLEAMGPLFLGELTTKQWFLLACLGAFFTEPPTVSQLARQMGTSHQNVKALALNLEKKGFVRLERDPLDARAIRIHTTEASAQYDRAHAASNDAFLSSLMEVLTPEELETVDRALLKLSDQMERMGKQVKHKT